jgi:malate/lactate dehydrogenase
LKNTKAMVLIVTNPVNSMVPLFAEMYRKAGVYDPKRIVGVTEIDVVRAAVCYAEKTGQDVTKVYVPVVGGHDSVSMVPLFSQATPMKQLPQSSIEELSTCCQMAGTNVINAKGQGGSATLSVACAVNTFMTAVLKGLSGQKTTACAYVDCGDGEFFAGPVEFDQRGALRMTPIPDSITDFEKQMISKSKKKLLKDISYGTSFISTGKTPVQKGLSAKKMIEKEMGA